MRNAKKINELIQHPHTVTISDLRDLNEVISEFPYFQALHAIHLKALKQNESFSYNQKLKETAAHTLDREVLFQFITNFNTSETVPKKVQQPEVKLEKKAAPQKTTTAEEKELAIPEKTADSESLSSPAEQHAIEPNQPLEFSKEERHSFSEWLKLTAAEPIQRSTEDIASKNTTIATEKLNNKEAERSSSNLKKKLIESPLIDKFLKTNPKIKPVKKSTPTINLATTSHNETDSLMTETLAKVYIAQKNYKKAIQAYKILSLKNPEKSGLFADQIRAIKKLQDNNL